MQNLLTIIKKEIFGQKEIPDNIPSDHKISEKKAIEFFYNNKDDISITWLGHASFLIKLGNINLLTDPYLSKTAGFFGIGPVLKHVNEVIAGLKRFLIEKLTLAVHVNGGNGLLASAYKCSDDGLSIQRSRIQQSPIGTGDRHTDRPLYALLHLVSEPGDQVIQNQLTEQ